MNPSLETRRSLPESEPRTVLVLLDLEPKADEPQAKQTSAAPSTANASRRRTGQERKVSRETPSSATIESQEGAAIAESGSSHGFPKIDWQREMEITVDDLAPKISKEFQQRCLRAERARAPRPPGCPRRSYEGPWRPSGSFAKDMRDPDRPRSSVPDDLPPAFSSAPPPQAFDDTE
jgi:hypothetical protein